MSDTVKIATFRVIGAATALLWLIVLARAVKGTSLWSVALLLPWLVVSGVFLLVAWWSTAARRAAREQRESDVSGG